jgi:oligosaccharide 4-alpha-D-glucosyltransferase
MRKDLFLILVFFVVADVHAQNKKEFKSSLGKYTVQYYSENIIKVTFLPNAYLHNENVSDAVLLKPLSKFGSDRFENTGFGLNIYSKNSQVHIEGDSTDGYYGFKISLVENEMIFGGGERALPLNRRGYRFNLYNNPWYGYGEGADNLNYSVPFITSSKGYGLFFDNPSKGYVDIGKTKKDVLEYGASSGEINVYVILGNYQQILQSYYKLTGTQPIPPRWAFGNLMSRFGYTSEKQVKDILQKMKDENIPVDAIIFDLFWFGDSIQHTLGNLDWINKKAWPDPKRMITDFKKEGINTILVTEPFFVETSKNYQSSKKYLAVDSSGNPYYLSDFYFGHGGLVDIFRSDSKQWFWQFYKKQMQNGVEAWWGDLGEPEKHPSNLYHNLKDYGYKRLFSADEVHNIYGHSWTKMLYDYYAKEYPNKRLFSLNRSGFAGSQRYSIFPWTGDVSRSWSGFRAQLPILLGMSMSGVPYVHSDAGGFAGGEGDNELYVRWLQFAAFTPIFRPHGTALYEKDTAAFSFPSEAALIDTPYREYAKLAISLRYMLMPYNYSLAYQQAKFGKPLMAPLYYYFANDTTAIKIQDEYMWGENILVAPVLEKAASERKVYLPEGKWQDISNKTIEGGKWITVPLRMEFIPIFIREGGFVPAMIPKQEVDLNNVSKYNTASAFLGFFPSSTLSSFEWYEDDGTSKNSIASGNFTRITCSGKEEGSRVKVSITPSNDRYLKKEVTVSVSGFQLIPKSVIVNGKEMSVVAQDPSQWNLHTTISKDVASWISDTESVQLTTKFKGIKKIQIEIIK